LALLELARKVGASIDPKQRDLNRRAIFHFNPELKRMSTIDVEADGSIAIHTKGAAETVLPCCTHAERAGESVAFDSGLREQVMQACDQYAGRGLRVLAIARRAVPADAAGQDRQSTEAQLTFLGLIAMLDPPRPEVRDAICLAHQAGIRIHVVTGDNGLTAAEIARRVGIGDASSPIVSGEELDRMPEHDLDELLGEGHEIVFARSSPEAKVRIADALGARGEVVAMTGDGVNDAPALRRSDIGVAMGKSGTDVAREAATMVLTDDNFATIVSAVESGRRVYDNVRKFITYIFAHAVPEVVPFLAFALSGGRIPLALTVLQVLAIDLGTDILPSLALSREPAEPGLMSRPPRPRSEHVITWPMLARAWGLLGAVSAVLVMAGFLITLTRAGWHIGAPVGVGSPLHGSYQQATTVAWLGIVSCQVGVSFAARTTHASLWSIGVFTNGWLLGAIAVSIAFAATLVYLPPMHAVFGTASLTASQLLLVVPFPFIVWGVDEFVRALRRRNSEPPRPQPAPS